jgi:NAD(P)-dependent dehydrogenase (short-subunit alcohol dehydrogenase family)
MAGDSTDPFRLDGRVAIVTGASSGLGVIFARALAGAGAALVLGARRDAALEELVAELRSDGHNAIAVRTDVTAPDDCEQLAQAALEAFGRVDVLVNNAGLTAAVPATREAADDFRRVMDVNVNGVYWMSQSCARRMEHGGSIINISSIVGFTTIGIPQAAYAASKAALTGLTRDLAAQWGVRKRIRVNGLAPGFFDAGMTAEAPPEIAAAQAHRIALGRPGEASDLAGPIVFLASDASSYVTGSVLLVDGGVLTA